MGEKPCSLQNTGNCFMTFIKYLEPYEKELLEKGGKGGTVVTVSGLSGSGKSEAAKMISRKLNLSYHSMGSIMREMAAKSGMTIEEFCSSRGDEVDHLVERETLAIAFRGDAVLDGRLTGWSVGNNADLKIFIFCPPEVRASRVSKRDDQGFEAALRNIFRRDMSDRSKYINLYGIDMLKTDIYDRIIDNSGTKQDLEERIDSIIASFRPGKAA